MKRLFNISALILLYILFTAKSCESDEQSRAQEEARTVAAKDSIAGAFTTDSLGNSALRAFEATAMAKIYDFGDYLKILSDTAAGGVFKAMALRKNRQRRTAAAGKICKRPAVTAAYIKNRDVFIKMRIGHG